jgi:DNA-binding NarL/FixJ family response regulator
MRILVADDHALFRAGLVHFLKELDDVVTIVEAVNFTQAFGALESEDEFDLILVDLLMPDMEAFTGLRNLRRRVPDVPIVVISALESRSDIMHAIDIGAMGYLPKSSSSEIMLSAFRLVLSGGIYLPPAVISDRYETPVEQRRESSGGRKRVSGVTLTQRQSEVLTLLARGKSNKEIARELGLAEGTVKIHITSILKALNVKNRTQAVIAAAELGDNILDGR